MMGGLRHRSEVSVFVRVAFVTFRHNDNHIYSYGMDGPPNLIRPLTIPAPPCIYRPQCHARGLLFARGGEHTHTHTQMVTIGLVGGVEGAPARGGALSLSDQKFCLPRPTPITNSIEYI